VRADRRVETDRCGEIERTPQRCRAGVRQLPVVNSGGRCRAHRDRQVPVESF
jgi:hypothetical protein